MSRTAPPSSLTKATIERAIAAMDARGHQVVAARICSNGDVVLLTETPPGLLPVQEDDGDWVSLAGAAEVSRA